MFPYPSGDLHMGHAEVFALHDVIARFWRLRGYEVLNPMGWDSFGLPAENAAIRNDEHPATYTYANIETQHASMKRYAVSFDWSRRLHTSDPEYYRWTQWLFLQLRERGLAYRKNSPVNWCPNDQTVLANEQVLADGTCERCGAEVTKRELTQWYFRTTAYAQELHDSLAELQDTWIGKVVNAQRNWIGRSEGAHVRFRVQGREEPVTVYTTRPDTLYGATFMVVAADAPLAAEIVAPEQRAALEAYVESVRKASDIDRLATDRTKTGVDLGVTATNPVTGEQVPVWASDYVLADYGTGAIMAVPGARPARPRLRPRLRPAGAARHRHRRGRPGDVAAWPPRAAAPTSTAAPSTGSPTRRPGISATIEQLEADGTGEGTVNFRLRDWLLSPPALLGRPDPDHPLPGRRRGARAAGPAAGAAARAARGRPEAQGHLAPGRGHRVGRGLLPDLRWPRAPRHRHDGHLRRLVVVLPALPLPARRHPGLRPREGRAVGADRPLRRRRRARRAAPALRPVLHQGAARRGPARPGTSRSRRTSRRAR